MQWFVTRRDRRKYDIELRDGSRPIGRVTYDKPTGRWAAATREPGSARWVERGLYATKAFARALVERAVLKLTEGA